MSSKIVSLAQRLQTRQISAFELTSEYLKKLNEKNSSTNAYIYVDEEAALERAKQVDILLEKGLGSTIAGIPMSIKDSILTEGINTTACSKMLAGHKPTFNATVYTKLLNNGAILLGKTNMDEFSMGSSNLESSFGPTSNPYNNKLSTGGSSGGSAASVAQETAIYSLGTDAGGSIRQPSSYCGVVGFKPSHGAVSRNGLIAMAPSFEQIGPISSCVEDAEIIFNIIKGKDPHDHTTQEVYKTQITNPIIGVDEDFIGQTADKEVFSVYEKALAALKKLNFKIVPIKHSMSAEATKLYYILAYAESASSMARYTGINYGFRTNKYKNINDLLIKTRSEAFGKEVKKRIMFGNYMLSEENLELYYNRALRLRGEFIKEQSKIFSTCDFILSPSTPTVAFDKKTSFSIEENAKNNIFALPANLAGLPSISIPFGMSKENLPIGMMITGKRFYDKNVFDIAIELEHFSEHIQLKNL